MLGIETHVQLLTKSKAYCSCPNEYGAEPNTHVCPVCLGHPVRASEAAREGQAGGGSTLLTTLSIPSFAQMVHACCPLPLRELCLWSILRWPPWPSAPAWPSTVKSPGDPSLTASSTSTPTCQRDTRCGKKKEGRGCLHSSKRGAQALIHTLSRTPQPLSPNEQISQYDVPICTGGFVEVQLSDGSKKRFGVTRAHLEEDAGKTVYGGAASLSGSDYSLVDYNRAGELFCSWRGPPTDKRCKKLERRGGKLEGCPEKPFPDPG